MVFDGKDEMSMLSELLESMSTCDDAFLKELPSSAISYTPNSNPNPNSNPSPITTLNDSNNGVSEDDSAMVIASNNASLSLSLDNSNQPNPETTSERKSVLTAELKSGVNWDDIFQIANCLHAFKGYIQLDMPVKLDHLVDRIVRITAAGVGAGVSTGISGGSSSDGVSGERIDANLSIREEDSEIKVKVKVEVKEVVKEEVKKEEKEEKEETLIEDDINNHIATPNEDPEKMDTDHLVNLERKLGTNGEGSLGTNGEGSSGTNGEGSLGTNGEGSLGTNGEGLNGIKSSHDELIAVGVKGLEEEGEAPMEISKSIEAVEVEEEKEESG
jgi:hypothetical protein